MVHCAVRVAALGQTGVGHPFIAENWACERYVLLVIMYLCANGNNVSVVLDSLTTKNLDKFVSLWKIPNTQQCIDSRIRSLWYLCFPNSDSSISTIFPGVKGVNLTILEQTQRAAANILSITRLLTSLFFRANPKPNRIESGNFYLKVFTLLP